MLNTGTGSDAGTSRHARPADVCLICEGAWPHVPGGLATWMQRLIASMPRLCFAVLYIGSDRTATVERAFAIPDHVTEVSEIFLHDCGLPPAAAAGPDRLADADWGAVDDCLRRLADGEPPDMPAICAALGRCRDRDELLANVIHGPRAWNLAVQHCADTAPQAPFLHHWWTGRLIGATTLALLHAPLPEARIYHAFGTGFAGLMGARAKRMLDRPFLLSEHGLHQRQRRIELFDAAWIRGDRRREHLDLRHSQGEFKDRWARYFRALARTAYGAADLITARSDAERDCQITDGADPDRAVVVPPGIDLDAFASLDAGRTDHRGPLRIGIVTPLVPERDATTAIEALGMLARRGIPFTATCLGPDDADGHHADACRELAAGLGLDDRVTFAGPAPTLAYYPHLDVVVVPSLVEDAATTALEACAAGLPVVASEVGACREVLLGRSPEDRNLGAAGLLVPPATPLALADALDQLAGERGMRRQMGTTGRERARRYYDRRDALHRHQELYEELLDEAPASGPADLRV